MWARKHNLVSGIIIVNCNDSTVCIFYKIVAKVPYPIFTSDTGLIFYSPNIKTNSYGQVFPLVLSEIGIMCFSPVFRHFVGDFEVPNECEFRFDYLSVMQPEQQRVLRSAHGMVSRIRSQDQSCGRTQQMLGHRRVRRRYRCGALDLLAYRA